MVSPFLFRAKSLNWKYLLARAIQSDGVCHHFQIRRKPNSVELAMTYREPAGRPLNDANDR
jgi:hypothetical protein